jgi:hypothetical protein
MGPKFSCEYGNDGRYEHGYGKVEASNEGIIPSGCFRENVVRQIMREINSVGLWCNTLEHVRFYSRDGAGCRTKAKIVVPQAYRNCTPSETVNSETRSHTDPAITTIRRNILYRGVLPAPIIELRRHRSWLIWQVKRHLAHDIWTYTRRKLNGELSCSLMANASYTAHYTR